MAVMWVWLLCLPLTLLNFHVGEGSISDSSPFRISKLNLMWEKAKKTLSDEELRTLYAEFIVQDRLEVDWKKRKAEGLDDEGQQEALIHRKFLAILDEFNLRASFPHESFQRKYSKEPGDRLNARLLFRDVLKADPKLAKLWKKAETSGFTDKELDTLQEEFSHHAEKVEEYEQLKAEIDRIEALSPNSIERFKSDDEFDGNTRGESIKKKHSQLKSIYSDLKHSYSNLQRLTDDMAVRSEQSQHFSDPRVEELWSLALKSNLTEDDLSSFKNELSHFERRINKYNHFEKELHMAQADAHMRGVKLDDSDPSAHTKMTKKVQEYALKVKKWYTELKRRFLSVVPHDGDEF